MDSSSPPNMSMLCDFVRDEKEDMKTWLRAEMNSLVDPLIDSLFHKFTNKLKNSLGQKQTGDGDSAQVMNQIVFNESSNFPSSTIISQPSTNFVNSIETSLHHNQSPVNHRILNGPEPQPNEQILYDANCQQLMANSFDQSTLYSSVSTNSQTTFNDEFSNFKSQPIKQEIKEISIESILENQEHCRPSVSVPASNEQYNQGLVNWMEEDEEDCDCDDCLNGGFEGIKQEDDDSVKWVEDCEESSRPAKKPKMDMTRQPNTEHCSRQANNEVINESTVFATLQLKCFQPNCAQMFVDKDLLDQHMLNAHSIRPFRCVLKNCVESFSDRQILREHVKQVHSNNHKFHCDYCTKHFTSYESLQWHTHWFHHLGQFKCLFPNCVFIGESRGRFKWHYKRQHKPELVCQHADCNYRTKETSHFKTHQRAHLGIKPYRCKWLHCDFSSTHRQNTLTHIRIHLARAEGSNANVDNPVDPRDYLEVMQDLL